MAFDNCPPTWISTRPCTLKCRRAAAPLRRDAGGVGVVNHHDGAGIFRNVAEAGQRPMSPSMEKETPSLISISCRDRLLRLGSCSSAWATSFMAKDRIFALESRAAVDDRGVIERIGNDEIVFAQDADYRAGVRREA